MLIEQSAKLVEALVPINVLSVQRPALGGVGDLDQPRLTGPERVDHVEDLFDRRGQPIEIILAAPELDLRKLLGMAVEQCPDLALGRCEAIISPGDDLVPLASPWPP